jgi:hypothetical protein
VVVATPLASILAPVSVKSTSSVVVLIRTSSGIVVVTTGMSSETTSMHSSRGVSTSVAGSGAQEMRLRMGIEGVAVGVLGIVGYIAGMI